MDKGTAPSLPMVDKLMKLSGYEKRLNDYFADYPLLIALPYLTDKEEAFRLKEQYARPEEAKNLSWEIYSKYMSGDDILNLIAFLKTPTGQKFVEHDEKIRAELQSAMLKLATDIAVEMVKDEINQRREQRGESDIDLDLPQL